MSEKWAEVQRFMQGIDPNGDWMNCPQSEREYVKETLLEWVTEGGIAKRVGYIIEILNT